MIVDHCCLYSYANIVGVLGEIPTFTLSPPGLFYGIKKFGIDNAADLYPYITALVPDMDLVSGWLCGWLVVGGLVGGGVVVVVGDVVGGFLVGGVWNLWIFFENRIHLCFDWVVIFACILIRSY